MAREIKLAGGEITLLKKIGLSGAPVYRQTAGRSTSRTMETAEFLETLTGLIDQGYVVSNKVNIRVIEDVERAFFRVNPALRERFARRG